MDLNFFLVNMFFELLSQEALANILGFFEPNKINKINIRSSKYKTNINPEYYMDGNYKQNTTNNSQIKNQNQQPKQQDKTNETESAKNKNHTQESKSTAKSENHINNNHADTSKNESNIVDEKRVKQLLLIFTKLCEIIEKKDKDISAEEVQEFFDKIIAKFTFHEIVESIRSLNANNVDKAKIMVSIVVKHTQFAMIYLKAIN
jgi:hypothetical protein